MQSLHELFGGLNLRVLLDNVVEECAQDVGINHDFDLYRSGLSF